MPVHSTLAGTELHAPFHFIQDAEPASPSAGQFWLRTGIEPLVLYRRNDANTAWQRVGSTGDNMIALLRDQFSVDIDPLVDGPAVPGPGTRDVTGNHWAALNYALRDGVQTTSPAWGSSKVVYDATTRVGGRTLIAYVIPSDAYAPLAIGFTGTTAIANPMTGSKHGWMNSGGQNNVLLPSYSRSIANQYSIHPKEYLLGIVLRPIKGAFYFLGTVADDEDAADNSDDPLGTYGGGDWRLLWVDDSDATATLYPYITALDNPVGPYLNEHLIADFRMINLASWSADNALATVLDRSTRTRTSGVVTAGNAEGIYRCKMTFDSLSATKGIGIRVRQVDANNFIRIWTDNTAAIKIQSWIAGGFNDTHTSQGVTWTVGQVYDFTVLTDGNTLRCQIDANGATFYDSAWVPIPAALASGTGFGPYDLTGDTDATWTDFAHYPHRVAIPADVRIGVYPNAWTPGTTVHTTATPTTETTYTTGLSSYEASISIAMGTNASQPAGLIIESGSGAEITVRIFDGATSEIEFIETPLGQNGVAKKIDLGSGWYATANGPFLLTIQVTPGLIRVFSDGVLRLSHRPNANFAGTTVKPYRAGTSDATFTNLVVKELSGSTLVAVS